MRGIFKTLVFSLLLTVLTLLLVSPSYAEPLVNTTLTYCSCRGAWHPDYPKYSHPNDRGTQKILESLKEGRWTEDQCPSEVWTAGGPWGENGTRLPCRAAWSGTTGEVSLLEKRVKSLETNIIKRLDAISPVEQKPRSEATSAADEKSIWDKRIEELQKQIDEIQKELKGLQGLKNGNASVLGPKGR